MLILMIINKYVLKIKKKRKKKKIKKKKRKKKQQERVKNVYVKQINLC